MCKHKGHGRDCDCPYCSGQYSESKKKAAPPTAEDLMCCGNAMDKRWRLGRGENLYHHICNYHACNLCGKTKNVCTADGCDAVGSLCTP